MVQNQYPCEHVVPIEDEPYHRRSMANEFVRVFLVEIAALERTLCHHHAQDYLMYVMGEAEIVSAPPDGEPRRLAYHDGDCELSSAGLIHVVENVRETKFRTLLVELLPRLNELHRGSHPRIAAGNGTVQAIFEEERISVWSVEMNSNTWVEAHGPAFIARLFEEQLFPKHPGNPTAKINQVSDITWIESGRFVLGSDLGRTVRAIVFQLGGSEEQLAAVRKRTGEPIKSLRAQSDEPE